MELGENYVYFFKNRGKCPLCKKLLVMAYGCVNTKCKIVKARRKNDEQFDKRMIKYKKFLDRVTIKNKYRRACFNNLYPRNKNIDITVKKTYNNDI